MKNPLKSLSNVFVACALLALASADAWSQTTCDLLISLADLAAPGEYVDFKTDISDSDCTTQVNAKIDKVAPGETKIEFKIDSACISSGQAQFTGTAEVSGDPPITDCDSDYDNPADPTEVGEFTLIADVPELQQLILDAAEATALQFPMGNPTADALVAELTEAALGIPACPCWTEAELDLIGEGVTQLCLTSPSGFGELIGLDAESNQKESVRNDPRDRGCRYTPVRGKGRSHQPISEAEVQACGASVAAECISRGF